LGGDPPCHLIGVPGKIILQRGPNDLEPQQLRAFVKGGVERFRGHDFGRPLHGPMRCRPVAAGLERHNDALGAPGSQVARGVFRRLMKAQPHLDKILLHLFEAGKGPHPQAVFTDEHAVCFVDDIEHLLARVKHVNGCLARLPVDVFAL